MSNIKVQNISKAYKKRQVLKDISLTVNSGKVTGLLGPNGAGKTTLFYIILGMINPDSGTVMLDSNNITNLALHQRARLGLSYLPQEPSIFRKLSVRDNILAVLEANNLAPKEQLDTLNTLLKEFNIEHIQNATGITLSGGERRRVEIARAIAVQPKFILLDEPLAGIDPLAINEIKMIIKKITARGIGILITDHNVRELLSICDQAYIINEGKVFANGTPAALINNEAVLEIYLGTNFVI